MRSVESFGSTGSARRKPASMKRGLVYAHCFSQKMGYFSASAKRNATTVYQPRNQKPR